MSLCKAIDRIYECRDTNIYKLGLKQGVHFLRKLKQDLHQLDELKKKHKVHTDKRGYVKETLFPITIDIINREEAPGKEVYVKTGTLQACVVYYGLSPELENFVTIVLWPDESKTSKQTYKKIFELITEDEERLRVIKFYKGYGHVLPNRIHPWVDRSINAARKIKWVYDWRYAPYLKEIGNTISSHKSPVNFQKIFSQDERRLPIYINLKSTVGKVLELRKNQVRVIIPSFYAPNRVYVASIHEKIYEKLKGYNKKSIYFFLIQEVVDDNVVPTISEIAPASPIEVFGSLIMFLLYTTYVGLRRLRLMNLNKYKKLYEICMHLAIKFCRYKGIRDCFWTPEWVFAAYLSPFVKKIDDFIYFVPFFLIDANNDTINKYDQLLASDIHSSELPLWEIDREGFLEDRIAFVRSYERLTFLLDLKRLVWWTKKHQQVFEKIQKVLT